jgi:hypothetical protein
MIQFSNFFYVARYIGYTETIVAFPERTQTR